MLLEEKCLKKLTEEEAKSSMIKVLGDEYTIIGKYVNNKTKIEVFHKKCKKSYFPTPKDIKAGKSKCGHCKLRSTLETYYDLPDEITKKYKIISPKEITDIKKKERVKFLCKCGHIFESTISYIKRGRNCPKCTNKKRLTKDELYEKIMIKRPLDGDDYVFLGEYKNIGTKMSVLHKKCNTIFKISPEKFLLRYSKCPKCFSKSYGVKEIINCLQKYQLDFILEKQISSLSNRFFDFYVKEYNLLIEYDGIQHFLVKERLPKSNIFYGKIDNYRKRDIEKNEFVEKNKDYTLIRFRKEHIYCIGKVISDVMSGIVDLDYFESNNIFIILDGVVYNSDRYYNM